MSTCTDCDRPSHAGWSDGEAHERCCLCETARALADWHPPSAVHPQRRTWTVEERRAYYRAYQQRRRLRLWRAIVGGGE